MKAIRCLSAPGLLLLACAGCTAWQTPVKPPVGVLYTSYRAPLTADVRSVPVSARRGTASTLYVREPFVTGQGFAWEEAGIATAARQGGLTRVHYADYEMLIVLGVFGRFTVHVYGE